MIKKTITYKAKQFDENDEIVDISRTENFYFNLTQAEALEINLMEDLEKVGASKDPKAIIPVFKRIIHYSYGVRLPSGKFTKEPAETTDFLASDAYSELFLSLLEKGEQGVVEFIRAVCDFSPSELEAKQASTPAPRQPQDHKQKETTVQNDPAEQKRVTAETTPQTPAERKETQMPTLSDAEYQEFLAYKQRNAQQVENGQHTAPSPATESPVQLVAESPIERPAHEAQSLRRED